MNFLTLFARNLRRGPYTEPFPFGPADAGAQAAARPHRIRSEDLRRLPAVREAVPVGRDPLLPHARRPRLRLLAFDLRLLRHMRVLLPERVDPPDERLEPRPSRGGEVRARRARPDPGDRLRRMRRQGARHRAQRRQGPPAAVGRGIRAIARALPEVPQQVSQEPGEDRMTRLPEDIQAQLAAAAPGGIDYSSTSLAARRRHRMVRPGEQRGPPRGRQDVASSSARGWRWSRRCSRRRPKRRRKREPARGEAARPSRRKESPRPSAARRSTASPMRSTTTSCSAATF